MRKLSTNARRPLSLQRETIRQLQDHELTGLRQVVGGSEPDLCATGSHMAHTCTSHDVREIQ